MRLPHLGSTLPAVLLLAIACGACGSSTPSTSSGTGGTQGTGGTGGSIAQHAPKIHRATATACPTDRPAGQPGPVQPSDTCKSDADCTAGKNGRCMGFLGGPNHCSYDACTVDADCGSVTACECRNPAQFGANTCVHGDCRTDADCGAGGYCSPSAVTTDASCSFGIDPGSVGYFCHTPHDACVDDADCPGASGEAACIFSVPAMGWVCYSLMCTG